MAQRAPATQCGRPAQQLLTASGAYGRGGELTGIAKAVPNPHPAGNGTGQGWDPGSSGDLKRLSTEGWATGTA